MSLWHRLSTNLVIYLMRRMGTDPAFASIQQMLFEGANFPKDTRALKPSCRISWRLDHGRSGLTICVLPGTCYITPILGAWLADSHWGRYKTILVFSIIYLLVRSCQRSRLQHAGLQCGELHGSCGSLGQKPKIYEFSMGKHGS